MTNSQQVIAQLSKQYGTMIPNNVEAQRWQYYDYVRLSVGGTNLLTFFANPLGSVDPVSGLQKTLEDTNIRRSGEFDNDFALRAIKTHIWILPAARQPAGVSAVTDLEVQGLTAVYQALRPLAFQGVLQVSFGQKSFIKIEQPFQRCPPGFGPVVKQISAHAAAGTFQPFSEYFSQSIDPRDMYVQDPMQFIEQGQTLQATANFFLANTPVIPQVGGANVAIAVGLIFDGYVLRPVQ